MIEDQHEQNLAPYFRSHELAQYSLNLLFPKWSLTQLAKLRPLGVDLLGSGTTLMALTVAQGRRSTLE